MNCLKVALLIGAAGLIGASVLVGCDRHRDSAAAPAATPAAAPVVYANPPPAETAAVAPPAAPVVVVQEAPPAPIIEVVETPQPGYVWIGGYWFWSDGRYAWVRGHSVLPPQGYGLWVEPRWEHGAHGWEHYQGHFEKGGEHREEHRGR